MVTIMPSSALNGLHRALDRLCRAYHEDEVTDATFKEIAAALTEEWNKIEIAIKATATAKTGRQQ
jgi:hypothetical protein